MLQFAQDDTSVELVLTLSERVTLASPVYHLVFTHVTTKDQVSLQPQDESAYPSRYNSFTINPSVLFAGLPVGEWHYRAYERTSAEAANGTLLEEGKLMLLRADAFSFTEPSLPTTFKSYNG